MINKNKSKDQIGKKLEGRGDLAEKEKLKKLASESGEDEFKLDLSTGLIKEFEEALKQNPKLKFRDWYRSRRQKLNEGGAADKDTQQKKFSERVIKLMDEEGFDFGEAVKEAMKEGYAGE